MPCVARAILRGPASKPATSRDATSVSGTCPLPESVEGDHLPPALVLRPDLDAHAVAPQLPEKPRLDAGRHFNHAIDLCLRHDLRIAVQGGEQLPVAERDADPSDWTERLRGCAQHAA